MQITPLQDWISIKIAAQGSLFDRSVLEDWQFRQIKNIVAYVYERSPFYHQRFAGLPLPQSMLQFIELPFTTAEDIKADPGRFVCTSQDEIQRIVTLPTSGTTGSPKRVYFTARDQELTIDFFQVGMSTLAAPGDRVLILLPGQRPGSVGDLLCIGLERLGCIPISFGPFEEEKNVLDMINSRNINLLVGSPVQLHRLARYDQAHPVLKRGQIEKVLSSTDILSRIIRANLQLHWGCDVFDHYGMTETGLGGGVECEAHQGYHLREADLHFEIIDPLTGSLLPDGQSGEIVVTTLTREGMPLVRYRTGDISRFLPGSCPCGAFIKRLEKIHTRAQAGVKIKTGIIHPSDLDEALFTIESILDFSATLKRESAVDLLELCVRFVPGAGNTSRRGVINALEEIPAILQGMTTGTLKVQINEANGLVAPGTGVQKRTIHVE